MIAVNASFHAFVLLLDLIILLYFKQIKMNAD